MQHYPLKDFLPDVQNQAIGVTEYDHKISDAELWELIFGTQIPPLGNISSVFIILRKPPALLGDSSSFTVPGIMKVS